jgi:hypothetical protein
MSAFITFEGPEGSGKTIIPVSRYSFTNSIIFSVIVSPLKIIGIPGGYGTICRARTLPFAFFKSHQVTYSKRFGL